MKKFVATLPTRRMFGAWSALGLAGSIGGCGPAGFTSPRGESPALPPPQTGNAAPSAGDTIGRGAVRIALIAPITKESGEQNSIGVSLRNAVDMAVAESGANDVAILVKDDHASVEGARAATQAALSEGAELFLGPLLNVNVREAGRLARAAGRPMIAFSTDASVATRGVYLLSFLTENYVERIIDFAAQRGKKSMAALIPETDAGNIAAGAFQTAAARDNIRVMAVERYRPGSAKEAIGRVAALGDQIDSLFIADQADAMSAIMRDLLAAGLKPEQVQLLSTGVWNDPRIMKIPGMQGAWFAAPDNTGFNAFAQKYSAKYGTSPMRLATLAYDAANLAIALTKSQGAQRFSESVLTNPSGFNGADGVFRFRQDGLNERGFAVMQIGKNGGASIISPAPRSFSAAPS